MLFLKERHISILATKKSCVPWVWVDKFRLSLRLLEWNMQRNLYIELKSFVLILPSGVANANTEWEAIRDKYGRRCCLFVFESCKYRAINEKIRQEIDNESTYICFVNENTKPINSLRSWVIEELFLKSFPHLVEWIRRRESILPNQPHLWEGDSFSDEYGRQETDGLADLFTGTGTTEGYAERIETSGKRWATQSWRFSDIRKTPVNSAIIHVPTLRLLILRIIWHGR